MENINYIFIKWNWSSLRLCNEIIEILRFMGVSKVEKWLMGFQSNVMTHFDIFNLLSPVQCTPISPINERYIIICTIWLNHQMTVTVNKNNEWVIPGIIWFFYWNSNKKLSFSTRSSSTRTNQFPGQWDR